MFWHHHASLHQGSFERVAHGFLGMKNDCMQIKAKQFDYNKIYFCETYFRNYIVQMKNELFTLEISWTKITLQKICKGNRILMKQKWRE